jgi:hypothetical protein
LRKSLNTKVLTTGSFLLLVSSYTFAEDNVIGRWCDPMETDNAEDNRVITFVYTEAEIYESLSVAKDGATQIEELRILPGNIYVRQGNV